MYQQMENRAGTVNDSRHFDLGRRVVEYVGSAILASLVYVVWVTVSTGYLGVGTTRPGWIFALGFALIFWLTGGFVLAFLLIILPWAIVVWAHLETRWDGRIYFPGVGALLVFAFGCTAASISPKPLWIEDQTFLEGAVIAAQRQGVCLLFCGVAFGACYGWLERQTRAIL